MNGPARGASLAGAIFECAVFNPHSSRLEYAKEPWVRGAENVLAIASTHRAAIEERLLQSCATSP